MALDTTRDKSFACKNYEKDGGDTSVIGGTLNVVSGGLIQLQAGAALIFPTADPHVAGAVWNNAGTLTISAG